MTDTKTKENIMTNTTATFSVRTYSIARDMWEAGDCAECAACGRNIRHVTEINGATYGTRCAEAILATAETVVTVETVAPVSTATFEAIEAAAISPMRKSIARQELAAHKLAAAAVYFNGDKTVVNRQYARPLSDLVALYQTRLASGAMIAQGLALVIEVKQALGAK
jgi:hypothetical protein